MGFAVLAVLQAARSPYMTRQNITREQPVQFSHKHHVGDDGIDCRYCHTSVEISAVAGIPPTIQPASTGLDATPIEPTIASAAILTPESTTAW